MIKWSNTLVALMGEKRKSMTFMGTGLAKKINASSRDAACFEAWLDCLSGGQGGIQDGIQLKSSAQRSGLASKSKPKASAWCFEPLFFTPAVHLEPPAATDELQE